MSLGRTLARLERDTLRELVERHGWNVAAAAREIEVPDHTLRSRLRTHGVTRPRRADRRIWGAG